MPFVLCTVAGDARPKRKGKKTAQARRSKVLGGTRYRCRSVEKREAGFFRYCAVRQRLFSEELGWYVTYGLRVLRARASVWADVAFVPDVSCNEAVAARIARQCTRRQLHPIHLLDVILDALP